MWCWPDVYDSTQHITKPPKGRSMTRHQPLDWGKDSWMRMPRTSAANGSTPGVFCRKGPGLEMFAGWTFPHQLFFLWHHPPPPNKKKQHVIIDCLAIFLGLVNLTKNERKHMVIWFLGTQGVYLPLNEQSHRNPYSFFLVNTIKMEAWGYQLFSELILFFVPKPCGTSWTLNVNSSCLIFDRVGVSYLGILVKNDDFTLLKTIVNTMWAVFFAKIQAKPRYAIALKHTESRLG